MSAIKTLAIGLLAAFATTGAAAYSTYGQIEQINQLNASRINNQSFKYLDYPVVVAYQRQTNSDLQADKVAAANSNNGRVEISQSSAVAGTSVRKVNLGSFNYQRAAEVYRGRRLQVLDGVGTWNAMAPPGKITLKSGGQIMIDNRSDEPVQVTLDGHSITLPPYEYAIVELASNDLSHTVKVDSNWLNTPRYNIAEIMLQR